jgi:hypothetical protein
MILGSGLSGVSCTSGGHRRGTASLVALPRVVVGQLVTACVRPCRCRSSGGGTRCLWPLDLFRTGRIRPWGGVVWVVDLGVCGCDLISRTYWGRLDSCRWMMIGRSGDSRSHLMSPSLISDRADTCAYLFG